MIDVSGLYPGALGRPIPLKAGLMGVDEINLPPLDFSKAFSFVRPGGSVAKDCPDYILAEFFPRFLKNKKFNFNAYAKRQLETLPSQAIEKTYKDVCPIHPSKNRHYAISELKRIGGFPAGFKFSGRFEKQWERIGNSVPPLFMKAIATQIKHKVFQGEPLKKYPRGTKYIDILEDCWQQHLKPKPEDAPTVISTFAGGGGSSLGYSMAGYRELLAVEWDNNAVATFKLNFPEVPVYHGDIAKLSVEECMRLAGLSGPGELDLFDGSPPCQGFSTAGKRILTDDRNQLFREYVRLLRGLKPKVFVMENVSGMVKGKMKLVFAEIMRELKASGYTVKAKLLNAKYFYVPQSRERLIFIGVREDLAKGPSYPGAKSRGVISRDALSELKSKGIDSVSLELNGKTSELLKELKPGQEMVELYEKKNGKGNRAYFAFSRLHPMRVSKSVTKDSAGLFHSRENRTLTIGEYKRISSFPDAFILSGSFSAALARIGNSVPPLFMYAISAHIKEEILSSL